jgi:hypothetical protein
MHSLAAVFGSGLCPDDRRGYEVDALYEVSILGLAFTFFGAASQCLVDLNLIHA